MNSVKFLTSFAYVASALLLIAIVGCATPVRAQNDAPPVTDIELRDGPNPGEVIISWNAVPEATHYRIGYVNMETDYWRAKASVTEDWLEAFVYVDVDARNFTVSGGRTEYTVPRLAQGVLHAFTVLTSNSFSNTTQSVTGAFSWPSDPRWERHTVADRGGACPTAGTPQPTPSPTRPAPTPTPSPTPTPQPRGDYDADNDGLIEITNLAQLDAIRYDIDGNGQADFPTSRYPAAFPDARSDMGCPSSGCAGYELAADLNFDTNRNGRIDSGDAYWNDGKGWSPIGSNNDNGLKTTFEGNDRTIANLYINRGDTDNIGLFGSTRAGGSALIRHVKMVGVDVTGGNRVGGLVGIIRYRAIIVGSSATGQVSGKDEVGGLVGFGGGSGITLSSAAVTVSGKDEVGGLVGSNLTTTASSSATGAVSGNNYVGGLAGSSSFFSETSIRDSHATGAVSGSDHVGGLVGENRKSITDSSATGAVSTGTGRVGGLVGSNVGADAVIERSLAEGNVTRTYSQTYTHAAAGGLVGYNAGAIRDSNATGNVTALSNYRLGALVGHNDGGEITNSYGTGTVTAR